MDIIAEGSVSGAQAGAATLAFRPNYTAQLGTIAVPTLILEGLEDPVYAFPIAQGLQAVIPGSTLALVPGASHVSIFEQPTVANQAINAWADAAKL